MLKKVALALVAVLLIGIAAISFAVWRYPIGVFNWSNRRSLRNTGFVESKVSTPVGMQTIFARGTGEPLIFLHGAGDHAGAWVKVADMFTARNRVILLDLAGHGNSEPTGSDALPLATVISALEAVMENQAPGQKVTIIGNSLGGWMAMVYADRHPDRVQRLVLVDGGAIRGERPDLVSLPTTREEARKMFAAVIDPGSPMPAGFVLDDVVRQANNGPMGRLNKAGKADMERYLLDGRLQQFATPTDLIWGESDKLIPLSYAHRLEAELPASRLTTLPRCGHIPQQECPLAFVKALKSVLAEPAPQQKAPTVPTQAEAIQKGKTT